MGRVEPELVDLGKALTRDATRRLRFIVHAASLLNKCVSFKFCQTLVPLHFFYTND